MQTEHTAPAVSEIAQHEPAPQEITHQHLKIKHPSRWKHIKRKLMDLFERLVLRLLSKILKTSPESQSRRL